MYKRKYKHTVMFRRQTSCLILGPSRVSFEPALSLTQCRHAIEQRFLTAFSTGPPSDLRQTHPGNSASLKHVTWETN